MYRRMLNTGAVRHPNLGHVIVILLVWHLFTNTYIYCFRSGFFFLVLENSPSVFVTKPLTGHRFCILSNVFLTSFWDYMCYYALSSRFQVVTGFLIVSHALISIRNPTDSSVLFFNTLMICGCLCLTSLHITISNLEPF